MLETPLQVGLVGAGCMGRGIAFQVLATPGMELAWVADLDAAMAASAADLAPGSRHGSDVYSLIREAPIDVFVEATNSIGLAADYCLAALEKNAHVILTNAEVDLALGSLLQVHAYEKGLIVPITSAILKHRKPFSVP